MYRAKRRMELASASTQARRLAGQYLDDMDGLRKKCLARIDAIQKRLDALGKDFEDADTAAERSALSRAMTDAERSLLTYSTTLVNTLSRSEFAEFVGGCGLPRPMPPTTTPTASRRLHRRRPPLRPPPPPSSPRPPTRASPSCWLRLPLLPRQKTLNSIGRGVRPHGWQPQVRDHASLDAEALREKGLDPVAPTHHSHGFDPTGKRGELGPWRWDTDTVSWSLDHVLEGTDMPWANVQHIAQVQFDKIEKVCGLKFKYVGETADIAAADIRIRL